MRIGAHHHIPLFRHGQRAQDFADALHKSALTEQKKRHVRTQLQAERLQRFGLHGCVPQMIEGKQHGSGIRAAAAQPAATGNMFVQPDFHAVGAT